MLLELLKPENIIVQETAKSWQEAGRKVGALLVENDDVTKAYIEATIQSVEKYGPYIVVADGIALFHARPEDGVNNMCMALMTLEDGVVFGIEEKDPVKMVFVFGAVDNRSHVKALTELMKIFRIKDMADSWSKINSSKELLGEIKRVLEA